MYRHSFIKELLLLLVLGALISFMAGCGEDATLAPSATETPKLARIIDADASAAKGGNGGIEIEAGGNRINIGTFLVQGETGGTFTCGRFTVTVPPGAVDGKIVLTIRDMTLVEGGLVIVELGPHGYVFNVPVTLTMDLSGTTAAEEGDATIYWYDEENEVWVDLDGTYDPETETVSVDLEHFSRYGGGGRAGW